jgi:hypothetical protein
MTQITTEILPLPDPGAIRVCTASTACPTTLLDQDDKHAQWLLADHEHLVHGIPLPKAGRRG